jgi:hypothetical protein
LLLSEIENFFEMKGIYNNTVQELRDYLLGKLPEDKVPSTKIIRRIMKEDFNLKFKRFDKANTKYIDSAYNEKRIWISRIVSQFLKEDAIIISIDESNYRHDDYPTKQW